jgi:murein DD-endopeptidase MepM/ murein hydrolase activator NlpD
VIAEKFGLRPETVLWGNYEVLRDNPQFLRPGQELTILPTDGVYYQWAEGDNLESTADFFRVKPEAIMDYPGNRILSDLTDPTPPEIAAGTWLIIPGGERDLKDWGPPAITRNNPAAAAYYGAGYCGNVYEGAIGTGAFIWPTVATYLSGYDYSPTLHPGIDIAGAEGNAVFATDSGVVVYAGWSQYGFGSLIVLDHGNGWQSAYAHLSAVNVGCGESVAQGRVIGAVGNTGNSTGPHLHFELRSEIYGKANPWNFVSP